MSKYCLSDSNTVSKKKWTYFEKDERFIIENFNAKENIRNKTFMKTKRYQRFEAGFINL